MAGRVGTVAQLEREAQEGFDRSERDRQLEHQRTLAQEARRREVDEFMKREGLSTVDDCRAYIRRHLKLLKQGGFGVHTFEEWCRIIKQEGIDRMALMDTDDDQRVLARMRRECVIDDENRVIPVELRAELRAAREEEEKRVQEELRARAMGEQQQ